MNKEKIIRYQAHSLLLQYRIQTVIANAYWNAFRQRNYMPDMCQNCEKRDICDGGCREAAHVYHGSIDAPDPLFTKEFV